MAWGRGLLAACFVVLAGGTAHGATQWKMTPGVTLAAGVDDNVLFNNQGGDQVARGMARLRGRAWDRLWHVSGDLSMSALGYNERQKLVFLGETTWNAASKLDRKTTVSGHFRVRAADDPLALAQVGLLAGNGRTLGYRSYATLERRLDRAWRLSLTGRFDGVRFLDQALAKDGDAAGATLAAKYRFSRSLTFELPVEERVFLQTGVIGTSTAMVPGVRWRPMRRTFLEAAAGPLAFFDDQGLSWLPVLRMRLSKDWRRAGLEVTAANDLTVPAGRGGVLAGQLLEGVARYGDLDWELRGRAGYYRSHPSPHDERWVPGYGLEAGAFRRLGGDVWLGVSALRFERLETVLEPAMSRDAIYLRLDITGDRP